jgi:glycosyltransferase involved in cell wall biosynthesis
MKPTTSIIVACKNRLQHLQQTLPTFVGQSHAEVIVVDYGCTQHTTDWVHAHYPSVIVVEVIDDPVFSLSRARNMGARSANGTFLLFTDADVLMAQDLGLWIFENVKPGAYYTVQQNGDSPLSGTVICARHDFEKMGGYDEVFRGWGWEDLDLYARFVTRNVRAKKFDSTYLHAIEHGDEERQLSKEQGGHGSRAHAMFVGRLYTNIKRDFLALTLHEINLEVRHRLMDQVKAAVDKMLLSDKNENKFLEISTGEIMHEGGVLSVRKLVYELKKFT